MGIILVCLSSNEIYFNCWRWMKLVDDRCPVIVFGAVSNKPLWLSCLRVFHVDGVGLSLNCGHQRAFVHLPDDIRIWSATVEWYCQGKAEELGDKPVPVPLCSPQIPRGFTRAWTWDFAARGWRLTAWAMARPIIGTHKNFKALLSACESTRHYSPHKQHC